MKLNISQPTLLIDEKKCKANIRKMVEKAKRNSLVFRPHFKTHQSRTVARWFKDEGVTNITVSSLGMAEYFASAGWKDITVAFPLNILQINQINRLAKQIKLNLLVDNVEVVNAVVPLLTEQVNIYIEIDTGGGRTGVRFDDMDQIVSLGTAVQKSEKLSLKGIYTHAGHSYQSRSQSAIMGVYDTVKSRLKLVKDHITEHLGPLEICMGDTPTCSVATAFDGVDAISPGNFVFYDIMQTVIGACLTSEIAVVMACPVVSKNEYTHEVFIYGGAVHFSKDSIEENDKSHFGKIVSFKDGAWSGPVGGCYVKSLSQEHGIIQLSKEEFEKTDIGAVIGILPVHSCLTAEAMGSYRNLQGDVIDHYAQKNRDIPG